MDRYQTSRRDRRAGRMVLLAAMAFLAVTQTGCIGLTSVLLHAWNGQMVEPAFDGLQGQRVAVVCTGNSAAYGPSPIVDSLAYAVGSLLEQNVPDLVLIPLKDVDAWKDENDWDELDFVQIGEGVGADMVVAIEDGDHVLDADPLRAIEPRGRTRGPAFIGSDGIRSPIRSPFTFTGWDSNKRTYSVFQRRNVGEMVLRIDDTDTETDRGVRFEHAQILHRDTEVFVRLELA